MSEKDLIKLYKPEIKNYTEVLWKNSDTYKEKPYSILPEWFSRIMLKRGEGMLRIAMGINQPYVIFPEYSPNFSMIVYKKEENEAIKRLKRLQMRYFDNISAPKADEYAKLASSIFTMQVTQDKQKNVIKLEDDILIIFSFPTEQLRSVLITLGVDPNIKF